MNGIGESRSELLNWLNELLKLNCKKVEECGTGAAYCQIMDSIYNDLPMHRVKFDAKAEYDFQTNYKILQSCFSRHHIEKTVYVEKLMRCKFQDNLEFLQWIKKYWIQNKDATEYDPNARRRYRPTTTIGNTNNTPANVTKRRSSGMGNNLAAGSTVAPRSSSMGMTRKFSNEQIMALQTELSQAQGNVGSLNKELNSYKETVNILERERSFYFGKLRDIEILVQTTQDLIKEGVYKMENDKFEKFLSKVQKILYATEDGFEIVEENQEENASEIVGNGKESQEAIIHNPMDELDTKNSMPTNNLIIDEETF
ncbi:hypothetical protein NCAS_0E02030 [Naumovozyma castellii]|uniref:Calponin-homology (CH) domain-containing protein n=1 Tax=Naumovozyma castellii TaxID=27288 RepID=G0VFK6_NAUCA|nr:hypothetical protein NCAS_0E02030 [Naumovozyma castellii CBS 4309]CCC70273.1 hypothetical protein NCAS_0E02030 [Naumovozyma castellii CBS 4309]